MLSNHLFLIIIFTIILIIFAEYQKLRNIKWILTIGCVTYVLLTLLSNIDIVSPQTPTTNLIESDSINIQKEQILPVKQIIDSVKITNDNVIPEEIISKQPFFPDSTKYLSLKTIAIATDIIEKDPTGVSRLFFNNIDTLYCFTAVDNPFSNNKIIHTWEYNGQDYLKSFIKVGESAFWRCWSRITIKPEMMGEWKVTITDTIGNYLDSIEFSIISTIE